jgi:hypothetical protein
MGRGPAGAGLGGAAGSAAPRTSTRPMVTWTTGAGSSPSAGSARPASVGAAGQAGTPPGRPAGGAAGAARGRAGTLAPAPAHAGAGASSVPECASGPTGVAAAGVAPPAGGRLVSARVGLSTRTAGAGPAARPAAAERLPERAGVAALLARPGLSGHGRSPADFDPAAGRCGAGPPGCFARSATGSAAIVEGVGARAARRDPTRRSDSVAGRAARPRAVAAPPSWPVGVALAGRPRRGRAALPEPPAAFLVPSWALGMASEWGGAGRVAAGRVAAGRVAAGRVAAGRVAAGRAAAGRAASGVPVPAAVGGTGTGAGATSKGAGPGPGCSSQGAARPGTAGSGSYRDPSRGRTAPAVPRLRAIRLAR